jgi:hypothetical protein
MLIVKKSIKDNECKVLKFNEFISEIEYFNKIKANRINLNFRLLNHENIFVKDFTYFLKLN